jgi:hypothetical protein
MKGVTWSFYDDRNSKNLTKLSEKFKNTEGQGSIEFDSGEQKEIQQMIHKIKVAKFLTSDWFILLITFGFIIVIFEFLFKK